MYNVYCYKNNLYYVYHSELSKGFSKTKAKEILEEIESKIIDALGNPIKKNFMLSEDDEKQLKRKQAKFKQEIKKIERKFKIIGLALT